MAKVATTISLDPDVKAQAVALFNDLGMDLSTAINVFLRQSIQYQGLPFELRRETPNATTMAALDEARVMREHPEQYKSYASFKDLMDEVLADA